jgi:hypothetical protein
VERCDIKKRVQKSGKQTYTEPYFPTWFSTMGYCAVDRNSASVASSFETLTEGVLKVFPKTGSVKNNKSIKRPPWI